MVTMMDQTTVMIKALYIKVNSKESIKTNPKRPKDACIVGFDNRYTYGISVRLVLGPVLELDHGLNVESTDGTWLGKVVDGRDGKTLGFKLDILDGNNDGSNNGDDEGFISGSLEESINGILEDSIKGNSEDVLMYGQRIYGWKLRSLCWWKIRGLYWWKLRRTKCCIYGRFQQLIHWWYFSWTWSWTQCGIYW